MDPLFLCRLALLAYIGALVAVAVRRRACVRAYFLHVGSPLDLAIARAVVFAVIAAAVDVTQTAAIAELPRALIEPPLGVGWVVGWLPLGGAGLAALAWARDADLGDPSLRGRMLAEHELGGRGAAAGAPAAGGVSV